MAKRRGRRDDPKPSLTDPLSVLLQPEIVSKPLALIEDRRLFHPDGENRPVMSINSVPINRIEVTHGPSPNRSRKNQAAVAVRGGVLPARVVFGKDGRGGKAVVCARRQERREVLFAAGKGGRKNRRQVRRNALSKIGC